MHDYDPRDWWWSPNGSGAGRDREPRDPDLDRLVICGLVGAICLCLASFAPPPLFAAVAAELLRLAALGSALEAVLRGERLLEERITAWDQAAALGATALLLGLAAGASAVEPGPAG
ncbi:hypothetical protein GCM10011504_53130 [Siccirubricoccus deserti]|uniref:Uncharacterized protein n=1 Tax=Siccirubricoccus deserti TaxID=2013562 RepID=A0A9X0R5M3_9PROT|nr:hypothetical protein [Siccirubricoccus deserti]MBC4018832.1 hypothetical protein [Siccirubricoccus deserti]GGC68567.1 hypothetical protein GCM10011504_53130 [Siccirubricoccus deserti]